MMRNKFLVVIEIIWIVTGVISILAGIKYASETGGSKVWIFAAMALISFFFAWLRHRQRKNSNQ